MKKGKTNSSFKKVSARVVVPVLGAGLGMSLLVSGGTFASWTASISQMTGANIQIGDWVAAEPPAISTDAKLPDAKVGEFYSYQLEASHGEGAIWSSIDSLPSGLSLSRDGLISGTPKRAYSSTTTYSISVRNAVGRDERAFTLVTIPAAPVFAESQVLPDAFDGVAYNSVTLTATGQYREYKITSGELPKGLTLSSAGTISGKPVGYGLFTFTVTVSNTGGSDSREFTINLNSDFPYITTTALPDATKNTGYSQLLAGSGPSPTYAIVSGELPLGLTLNATTGRISGAAYVHGLSNFTISKTNSLGTVTQDLSIYVRYEAPTITTSSMSTVRKNVAYSRQIAGIGEESTFAISEGRLPDGITLHPSTGLVSGVTTEIGDFSVTITRTNESGVATRTYEFQSRLVAPYFEYSSYTLPYAYQGIYYEGSIPVKGEEIVWSATGLPDGLSIDPSTGLISGTPTTVATSYLNIIATNTGGSDNHQINLRIRNQIPEIETTSLSSAEVGQVYSETLSAIGNAMTYRITGTLPAGITFNASTGVLSGTPTKAGTFSLVFYASTNGGSVNQPLTLTVEPDFPTITTTSFENNAMHGVTFSAPALTGNGVDSTYSVSAGALPPGMYLSNGRPAGTPSETAHGPYTFTIAKTNSRGTATQEFTLNVVYQTPTLGSVSNRTFSKGYFNVAYKYTIPGIGGGATYAITEGTLPDGITIGDDGIVSGIATETGQFVFTLQKTNESGSVSKEYSFSVVHVAPVMVSSSYPRATINVPYSFQVQAKGLDLTFRGTLPDGLNLDTETGLISGTPTTAKSGRIYIYVSNSGGEDSLSSTFYVDQVAPTLTTTSLPNGMVGEPYSAQIEAVGEGITYYIDSSTPSGLSINSSTGVISGTPRTAKTYTTVIRISNTGGSVTRTIPITIVTEPPTITVEKLAVATVGKSYTQSLSAGAGTTNQWTITVGKLPPGISMSLTSGYLSGTPTTRGDYTFTMTKTNDSGAASKEFTLEVRYVLPTITTAAGALKAGVLGQTYGVNIGGTGGVTDGVTFSISNGELPPGLTINETGRIAGIPTASGNYTFTVLKSNLDGEVSKEFSINIP